MSNATPGWLRLDLQVMVAARGIPDVRFFESAAAHTLDGLRQPAELCLRVVGRRESRQLNQRFRGIDKATNVLAFAAAGVADVAPDLLGDIVICAPLVFCEARAQAKSRKAHFAHLTVHGVLHLLGFDHLQCAAAKIMEDRERAVLSRLGFADPYAITLQHS